MSATPAETAAQRLAALFRRIIQPGCDQAADGPLWLLREGDRVLVSPAAFAVLGESGLARQLPGTPRHLAARAVDEGDPVAAGALLWPEAFALGLRLAAEERSRHFLPAFARAAEQLRAPAPLPPAGGAA